MYGGGGPGMVGGGGLFGRPPGGPMGSGLTHSSDLSDDIVFGHVYDQESSRSVSRLYQEI